MKSASKSIIIAWAIIAASAPARANHNAIYLSPKNTAFHMTGTFSLFNTGVPLSCKITMSAITSAGGEKLNAGSIEGVSSMGAGCDHIVFSNLPYTISISNQRLGFIGRVTYTGAQGTCNNGVLLSISKRGDWTFGNSNGCGFNGSAKSSPVITISKTPS